MIPAGEQFTGAEEKVTVLLMSARQARPLRRGSGTVPLETESHPQAVTYGNRCTLRVSMSQKEENALSDSYLPAVINFLL